jgi:hypothetical protein
MPNKTPHCAVSYHQYSGTQLDTFGHSVLDGIYNNSGTFASPPINKGDYQKVLDIYHDAYENYKNGGKSQKGAYTIARTNLTIALDSLGNYVETLPGVDEGIIQLSGFEPTKTGDTKAVPPTIPNIDKLTKQGNGTISAECFKVDGAEYYGCLVLSLPLDTSIQMVDGMLRFDKVSSIVAHVLTKSRKKTISALTPVATYWVYFYAANSAGVSGISKGMSILCE